MSFNRTLKAVSLLAVAAVVALSLAACSSSRTSSQAGTTKTQPPATTSTVPPTIAPATTPPTPLPTVAPAIRYTPTTGEKYSVNFGETSDGQLYLTDGQGRTLYYSTADAHNLSMAGAAVIANWPVFYTANITVPTGLDAADFGSITRADGTMQTTFKGWPLYYFVKDTAPGQANGQGLKNAWFTVDPDHFTPPQYYSLNSGWEKGNPVKFYDFGVQGTVDKNGTVHSGGMYILTTGTGANNQPVTVPGQHAIVDIVPGDTGYTGLWKITYVTVPANYVADTVTSFNQIVQYGFTLTPTDRLVDRPIVPAGSVTQTGTSLVQGWYQGRRIYYFDFGASGPTAMPMYDLITGYSADGTPQFVDSQGDIINALPGESGYSAFCRLNLVTVPGSYTANTFTWSDNVTSSGYSDNVTNELVNCPLETGS